MIGGDVDFVVMGMVNVVGAEGFIAAGTAAGFVCPKDNFPAPVVVVVEGVVLGNGGDILNALVVIDEGVFTPELISNPPKADVKSPNALPPPAIPPPTAVPTGAVGTAADVTGTDCFGAYNFKILFFKSFLDTAAVPVPADDAAKTCGADWVRTGESNSNPNKL